MKNIYVAHSVYLLSVSRYCSICLSSVLSSSVHFYLPPIFLIEGIVLLSVRPISHSISAFLLYLSFSHFVSHWSYLFFSIVLSDFSNITSLSIAFVKSVLSNVLADFTNDYCLKIEIGVVLYEEQDGIPKAAGSATIFGAEGSNLEKFQHRLHGSDLKRGSGSDQVVNRDAGSIV